MVHALFAATLLSFGCTHKDDTSFDSEVHEAVARCDYRNAFNSEPECKEYWGTEWTLEDAADDCETDIPGGAGTLTEAASCDISPMIGICTVSRRDGTEYTIYLGGDDEDLCSGAELACTAFARGSFRATGVCVEGGTDDGHTVFIWPYESCDQPIEGEDPGNGPDGTVCTNNLISGCTEEGRDFRDYGSCDVIYTNRPYYPVEPYAHGAEDDPRLSDDEFLAEVGWVTEQLQACACVCCHSGEAPEGPAIWGIDSEVLWPDQMSDTAVGMFAGYIDSSALGAYPEDDNNGFNRTETAMPSTDPARMVAFWEAEMERRGLIPDDLSDEPPVGQELLDQVTYDLPDCEEGTGLDADGSLYWDSDYDARYLYVLEEGSSNPGLPPNFDMPEGILWRVDIPYTGQPMEPGVTYGELPATAVQRVPTDGSAPELVPGTRYHLYALYDVALPIGRCVFVAPEPANCGTTAPAAAWGVLGLVGLALARRRRA